MWFLGGVQSYHITDTSAHVHVIVREQSWYCKSRIFHAHFIFVYFVHGGFRTKMKCVLILQNKAENLQRLAAVRKLHAFERSEVTRIRTLSAYEIFWIYSTSQLCGHNFIARWHWKLALNRKAYFAMIYLSTKSFLFLDLIFFLSSFYLTKLMRMFGTFFCWSKSLFNCLPNPWWLLSKFISFMGWRGVMISSCWVFIFFLSSSYLCSLFFPTTVLGDQSMCVLWPEPSRAALSLGQRRR